LSTTAAQTDVGQTSRSRAVARPLKVLVPLIRQDLEKGEEAAKQAAVPFYKDAGEKLIEAKAQLRHGEWGPWLKRNFNRSERSARLYMSYAEATAKQNGNALPFSSLNEFNRTSAKTNPVDMRPDIAELKRANDERLPQEEWHRRWMLTIVTEGYREFAKVVHPDKGGSAEDMAGLNKARDSLKKMIGDQSAAFREAFDRNMKNGAW
jgi:hypothetical protein